MTFRAFSIGFSAALLALACGSDDNGGNSGGDEGDDPVVRTPVAPPPPETCEDNILLAGCQEEPAAVPGTPGTPNTPVTDPLATQKAQAENILASRCGSCHGPALSEIQAQAGMNYVDDMDQLALNGQVIPNNSERSLIIQRMTNGSMPPLQSGLPRVPQSDIDIVAQYIDNPLAWPDVAPSGGICENEPFDFDQLYQAVATDLQRLDADDALTARYISLTNRFTAGVCADTSLDRDRQALTKMLNSLSTDPSLTVPEPIDRDQLIYRIDLADYGWDQPVTIIDADGVAQNFNDKWEGLIANNPYAVEFEGEDADQAKLDANTTVPVMFADQLIDVATIGNVYYAMIDVDVTQTLDDFILNVLQINQDDNLADGEQVRAGTTRSRISRQDRLLQRDEIEIRNGVLWQSFDFLADDQNDSIFEDPFGFAEGGIESIFTLPNGMMAFIIADENNLIVEDSNILLDTSQQNFRAITSISCHNCHSVGFIQVEDEVREVAISNALSSGLNRDEIEQLEEVFPTPAEFARVVEDDTNRFFRNSLSALDLPVQGADPISFVFTRFDQRIDLATAAGDLGVSEEFLDDNIQLLEPEVNVLQDTRVDRDDFTVFFVDSLCKLSLTLENQPAVAACDQAALDVLDL